MSLINNNTSTQAPYVAEVLAAFWGAPADDAQSYVKTLGLEKAVAYCEKHLPEDLFSDVRVAYARLRFGGRRNELPAGISYYDVIANALDMATEIDLGMEAI